MGAISFDPSPWLNQDEGEPAKVANSAKVGGDESSQTLTSFATLAGEGLSAPAMRGLGNLSRLAPPLGIEDALWQLAVTSALRLRDDGWASQAVAMGWRELDLFGWSGSQIASDQSLVEWLGDRPVRAILEDRRATVPGALGCVVIDAGHGKRAAFNMRERDITKFIWEAGR